MNKLMAHKSFLKIFFTLLLIVMVMFISNFFVYKNSIDGIYTQVKENNSLVVHNIIQSFDGVFRNINNLIYSVHMLPYDTDFTGTQMDMYSTYNLQNDISTILASSSAREYVEEVIVFYTPFETAITSTGTIRLKELFSSEYNNGVYNSLFWTALFKKQQVLRIFPVDRYEKFSQPHVDKSMNLIAVASNNVYSRKNLIILIDYDKLLKYVGHDTLMQGTDLIVLDSAKNMILSTEDQWGLVELFDDVYLDQGRETTVEREDYQYTLYKSNYNGFIYINKMLLQFTHMDLVSRANLLIMYWTIIIAVILVLVLSFYLFRPVQGIMKLLGGGSEQKNNYQDIQSGIVKIQEQNKSYKSKMDILHVELRRGMFLNAIEKLPHNSDFEVQLREHFADFFKNRMFVMVSLYLKPVDGGEFPNSLNVEEITTLICNEFQMKWQQTVVFHSGSMRFLVLLGLQHVTERKVVLNVLNKFVNTPENNGLREFEMRAVMSKAYESKIDHLESAYKEIQNVMTYRSISDTGPVFKDVSQQNEKERETYFPLMQVEKLSNCLISGNEVEGAQIIRDIIAENAKRQIHQFQFELIAKFLYGYIRKYMMRGKGEKQDSDVMQETFYHKAAHSYDYREIQAELVSMVNNIAGQGNQLQKNKMDPAFVSQYIELHYMESLYLDHMAEIFETTPKYFSNYFKKTFGVNFIDYLNKVRLAHAKEFLKNKEMSVATVGEHVGYMNSSTFTTTFKKYVGISPSQYRNEQGKKN